MKGLYETCLPHLWSQRLLKNDNFDIAEEHMNKIINVLFTGAAQILSSAKSKDHPVAFVFQRIDEKIIAASIVEYFEPQDASQVGNYSMSWTFNESDIPENAVRISLVHPESFSFFTGAAASSEWRFTFKDAPALVAVAMATFASMRQWLDENASESEEIGFELPGVMQARVSVENGVKVFALEAAGEIKQLIKNDASIEK